MRVLHLDSGRVMGGGQWQALRLIEGLAAEGVESTLLAREGAPLFVAAREKGWKVEGFGLMNALLSRRCDLVHAHDARGHTLGALAGGAPLVVSRRVAFPVRSRWKYQQASRYIAVSEAVKSVLMAGGVESERISVVYDGVPVLEVSRGMSVVSPQKGAEVAIEAARLAGEELIVSTDLERDLLNAGIFVYVTESEGLGSGVLLAMSAGVPVIASNVGGVPEIIRHKENGLLIDDVKDIPGIIRLLRLDTKYARCLGTAGRQTVMERFTVDQMVRRTMEVYRQVLA